MSGQGGERAEFYTGSDAADDAMNADADDMDAAVAAATSWTGFPAHEAPSAEAVAAARARAAEMISEEDKAGLRDLHALTLSMGLPATRATFQFMVAAAKLRGAAKKDAMREIADLSPVTEVGCMEVRYINRATGSLDKAYLVLDRCPRDHDFGAQLEKLRPLVPDDKWADVTRALSMLFHIGRTVYSSTARGHVGLIRMIRGAGASDPCTEYLDLKVDSGNTTLYLEADWPERVGIYVRLGAEVEAEVGPKS